MPMYLVRWPTLRASLVRARDEDELIYYLDEVADPGGCTYKVYKGPIWIDFDLPFTIRDITPEKKVPTEPSDFTVDPPPGFAVDDPVIRAEISESEAAGEMRLKILRFAFPSLAKFLDEREDAFCCDAEDPDTAEPYPAEMRAALVADLMPLVKHCQACADLRQRDDLEAELMKVVGVTIMLPSMRRGLERALTAAPSREAD
jgi:hypothetical protein